MGGRKEKPESTPVGVHAEEAMEEGGGWAEKEKEKGGWVGETPESTPEGAHAESAMGEEVAGRGCGNEVMLSEERKE